MLRTEERLAEFKDILLLLGISERKLSLRSLKRIRALDLGAPYR